MTPLTHLKLAHPHARPVVLVENPMPATDDDIFQLKALLRWAKGTTSGVAKEQALIDALERAIAYLEEPDARRNIIRFCLAALRQSVRKSEKTNVWYVVDHNMYDWAMQQIHDVFSH